MKDLINKGKFNDKFLIKFASIRLFQENNSSISDWRILETRRTLNINK